MLDVFNIRKKRFQKRVRAMIEFSQLQSNQLLNGKFLDELQPKEECYGMDVVTNWAMAYCMSCLLLRVNPKVEKWFAEPFFTWLESHDAVAKKFDELEALRNEVLKDRSDGWRERYNCIKQHIGIDSAREAALWITARCLAERVSIDASGDSLVRGADLIYKATQGIGVSC